MMFDVNKAPIWSGTIVPGIVAAAWPAGQAYPTMKKARRLLATTRATADKAGRVYGSTIAQHLEMDMRPGRSTATAH